MKNIINEEIAHYSGYIEEAQDFIAKAKEVLEALGKYTGSLINKSFFEEYFKEKNEWREYTKYAIQSGGDYTGARVLSMYIGKKSIRLPSRNRLEIITCLESEIKRFEDLITDYTNRTTKLEDLDQDKIFDDIKAIYNKYDKPAIWYKLLSLYEFQNPENY